MKLSKRGALVSGSLGWLALSVGFMLVYGLATPRIQTLLVDPYTPQFYSWQYWELSGLAYGLPIGLVYGLAIGLRRGGATYLRHPALRWLLTRDRLSPWDYVVFLDHAAGLILLRRRGGGYEFIHRLLLEYFASLKANPSAAVRPLSSSVA